MFKIFKIIVYIAIVPTLIIGSILTLRWMEAREDRFDALEKLTDQAIKDYTKAIELNPELAEAYDARGFVYFDKLGDKNRGCTDWKKACDLGVCENYNLAKRNGDCK